MRRAITGGLVAVTLLVAGVLAAPAPAFELRDLGVRLNDPGTADTPTPNAPQLLAGAHPDLTVDLKFPADAEGKVPDSVRSVDAQLPSGFIIDPGVVPTKCPRARFAGSGCPTATQVGLAYIRIGAGGDEGFELPLFALEAPPGVPARLGFNAFGATITVDGSIRTGGDYGITARVADISQGLQLTGARLVVWGVPGDAVHDLKRVSYSPFTGLQYIGQTEVRNPALDQPQDPNEPPPFETVLVPGVPAGYAPRALTSNPGRCTGEPLRLAASATGWTDGTATGVRTVTTQQDSGAPLTVTGCDALPFDPSLTAQPTTAAPDSPTGLDVTLRIPQSDDPGTRSSAHLKDLSLLLPDGMNVNPSAADGLTACTPAQIELTSAASPTCPKASSLGTVAIDTPLLNEPLRGSAYLASQGDNPFGTTLAMYLVAEGNGAVIKLAGRIDADPATGRLRVTFTDNPELPFSQLRVGLRAGPRAVLTTPATCGAKTVEATATPWSGQPAKALTDGFSIDCTPGLGGFAPTFAGGTVSATAGQFSPLALAVRRPDGQAALQGLTVRLPPGLLARLAGVPLCGDAQASAGTCDAASRVGGATVAAGAGSSPFPLAGDVFLTGPYEGAPYGLAVRVRALAGPLDLGTVVVRQTLSIDPETTAVTAVSDPLPTILAGIPIRLRSLDVRLDRPDFTVNPTSCAVRSLGATLGALGGASATLSTRFAVGGCAGLPLTPKLSLGLRARGATLRDGGHPGITARLTQPAGQSGLKRVEVKLPLSLALDPGNAQALCDADAGSSRTPACPAKSAIGTASVRSPLLPKPLEGPVYFVKGTRKTASGKTVRTLPKLVLPLRGNGVQINVRANTTVRKGRLVTQFDGIPDAPIGRFDLSLNGGRHGVLVVSRDVCKGSRDTGLRYRGQSGRLTTGTIRLGARCG